MRILLYSHREQTADALDKHPLKVPACLDLVVFVAGHLHNQLSDTV